MPLEEDTVQHWNSAIPVRVIRSDRRRRTIAIQVHPNEVVVRAPSRTSDHEIHELLASRSSWIESANHLAKLKQERTRAMASEYVLYRGKRRMVRCIPRSIDAWRVDVHDDHISVFGPEAHTEHPEVRAAIHAWYRREAKDALPARVRTLAHQHGFQPNVVRVKEQKSRWGSCSAAGNINLNWRLIMAPPDVLDYVIIHELCHLHEMNHSDRFWKLVRQTMPEFEAARTWLREHADALSW